MRARIRSLRALTDPGKQPVAEEGPGDPTLDIVYRFSATDDGVVTVATVVPDRFESAYDITAGGIAEALLASLRGGPELWGTSLTHDPVAMVTHVKLEANLFRPRGDGEQTLTFMPATGG